MFIIYLAIKMQQLIDLMEQQSSSPPSSSSSDGETPDSSSSHDEEKSDSDSLPTMRRTNATRLRLNLPSISEQSSSSTDSE